MPLVLFKGGNSSTEICAFWITLVCVKVTIMNLHNNFNLTFTETKDFCM